jgi:hypothetical protein
VATAASQAGSDVKPRLVRRIMENAFPELNQALRRLAS